MNKQKILQLESYGYITRGIDINRKAVKVLDSGGVWASQADARLFGSGDLFYEIPYLESIGGAVCQGLFPSLLGDNWKQTLDAIDMWLRPGSGDDGNGYLFVADVLRADTVYDPLLEDGTDWEGRAEAWRKRYRRNVEAFGDELPERTFVVGAEGPLKNWLDWEASPQQMKYVYKNRERFPYSEIYERMATHLSPTLFEYYLEHTLGYEQVLKQITKWGSRSKDSLAPEVPGALYIYRKPDGYRYHPGYQGWPVEPESERKMAAQNIMPSPYNLIGYYEVYFERLLAKCPKSQRPMILEMQKMIRAVG